MYIIFVILIFVFVILILMSLGKTIPKSLNQSGIFVVFYKVAAFLLGMKQTKSKDIIRAQKFLLLFPGENVSEQIKEYEIKKLGLSLALIFAGIVLSLLMILSSLTNSPFKRDAIIERNNYGEGSKQVKFDIYADGELVSRDEELKISERIYSEEEINKLFDSAAKELDSIVLGKNKNCEAVIYDLNFTDILMNGLVSVEWELNNYEIMDRNGVIHEDKTVEEGTAISITANLGYSDQTRQHVFNIVIYPRPKKSKESLYELIINSINEYENATKEYEDCILPTQIDGKEIAYKTPEKYDAYILFLLFIIFAITIFQAKEQDLDKSILKRDRQMMIDYPNIVSKFSLFISAGMTIKGALEKVSEEYLLHKDRLGKRFAYEEMLITLRELQSGISEADAFIRFGERCRLQKYVKFGSLLAQNLKRGNSGLISVLEAEEREAFEERKNMAKKLGEEAGTKLLIPMVMMLGIVMIIVIVPAFLSFTF